MKKQFLLLTLLLCYCVSNAQNIEFPEDDESFKNALLNQYRFPIVDTDYDGEISYEEAEALEFLELNASEISNLEGIEYFVNVNEWIHLDSNSLTSIDVSENVKVKILSVNGNDLTEIYLPINGDLETLRLDYNYNLTEIDLSGQNNLNDLYMYNTDLTELDLRPCSLLTSFNLANNTNLQYIYMTGVPIESVSLAGCTSLEFICVDEDYVALINEELDEQGITGVTVSTDCDEEEEVVYEFSDLFTLIPTDDDMYTLTVTELGLSEGIENGEYTIISFEEGYTVQQGEFSGEETILDFSDMPDGICYFFITLETSSEPYTYDFYKL